MNTLKSKQNSAVIVLLCIIMAFLLVCFAAIAQAADVTLTWTAPDDSRVTGYFAYHGIEAVTESKAETAETSCLITDLEPGQTYLFSATSHDADLNESAMEQILEYTIPLDPVVETIINLKAPITIRIE